MALKESPAKVIQETISIQWADSIKSQTHDHIIYVVYPNAMH